MRMPVLFVLMAVLLMPGTSRGEWPIKIDEMINLAGYPIDELKSPTGNPVYVFCTGDSDCETKNDVNVKNYVYTDRKTRYTDMVIRKLFEDSEKKSSCRLYCEVNSRNEVIRIVQKGGGCSKEAASGFSLYNSEVDKKLKAREASWFDRLFNK